MRVYLLINNQSLYLMRVLKFGGSSVKSADRIKQVASIIGDFVAKNENVYVVVSAFGGKELMREAYEEAIKKKYRFYSYGDAMLIK